MLTPILDKTPEAEVIIEDDRLSIIIPTDGKFKDDYVTPQAEANHGERTVFRTILHGR